MYTELKVEMMKNFANITRMITATWYSERYTRQKVLGDLQSLDTCIALVSFVYKANDENEKKMLQNCSVINFAECGTRRVGPNG